MSDDKLCEEETKPVITYRTQLRCKCGAKYHYTGISSLLGSYLHECDGCGATVSKECEYPKIEYIDLIKEQ